MKKTRLPIYAKFLFTYLAIIAILLTGLLPVYSRYVANLREKEIDKVVQTLETGIARLEQSIVDLSWAVTSLEEGFTYRLLTAKSESLAPRELYAATQVQKSFALAIRSISLVEYAFLSFLNNDIILDGERVYRNSDNYYGAFIKYTGQDFDSIDDLQAAAIGGVLPCQPVVIRTQSTTLHGEYVTLLFSNSYGQSTRNTIFALFARAQLETLLLSPGLSGQGALSITDRNGQQILLSNPAQISVEPDTAGVMHIDRSINLLGLSVRVMVPQSVYAGDLWRAASQVLIFALVALFFSTMAAFVFAYRTAKPIHNTLQHIRDIGMDEGGDARDAFGFINRALESINIDRDKLSVELRQYEKRLHHQTIENLLGGYVVYADDPQNTVRLAAQNRLLLFSAGRFKPHERMMDEWAEDYGELKPFVAYTLIKDSLPEGSIVHETHDRDIAVILPEDAPARRPAEIEAMARGILATLQEKLHIHLRVAVGWAFCDPNQLSREYTRAKNALETSPATDDPFLWLPAQGASNAYPDLTPAVINQIYELLMMGAYDRLMAVLDIVFTPEILLSEHFKQAYYSVRGRLLTVCHKMKYEEAIGQGIADFDPKKTHPELLHELRESCRILCERINSQKISRNQRLVSDIIGYIRQHYTDSQLNATAIAERFHISSKYMSQFIKSQTGRTYSEYLETLRLEHALELLKDPHINISQIAAIVGFANQNTFYKAFRRVYNVSPSTWRSSGEKD